MGKIMLIGIFLITNKLQSQIVLDSIIIYDYQSANKLVSQSGHLPISIKIQDFDIIILDAGVKSNNRNKSASYSRSTIPPMPLYLIGVKIYFPKDSILSIHVKGKNKFRKRNFELDTILTINKNVLRPLVFWAMLRQKYQNGIGFYPTMFTLTNEDFTSTNLPKYVIKILPENLIRYTCNTLTKELIDLWAKK